jgi:hypothetical protein
MYLKTDYLTVTVGGLSFESTRGPYTKYVLDPDALSGWTDGVDVRRDTTSRPIGWGDFPEDGRLGSRLITVTGSAVAQHPQELHRLRDQFVHVVAPDEFVEISVRNMSGYRYASVTMASRPVWTQITDFTAAWKLELYAPDPRIYSHERVISLGNNSQSGGVRYVLTYPLNFHTAIEDQAQNINNAGNVTSWPKFYVDGDLPTGFSLSNGKGKIVEYGGPVTPGAAVIIDMAKGNATQHGADRSFYLRKRQWWGIPANQEMVPYFFANGTGTGRCDIIIRDTWI